MDFPPPLHRPQFLAQFGTLVTPLLPPPMRRTRWDLVLCGLIGFALGILVCAVGP